MNFLFPNRLFSLLLYYIYAHLWLKVSFSHSLVVSVTVSLKNTLILLNCLLCDTVIYLGTSHAKIVLDQKFL